MFAKEVKQRHSESTTCGKCQRAEEKSEFVGTETDILHQMNGTVRDQSVRRDCP